MQPPRTKLESFADMQTERARLERALARIPKKRMEIPGAQDEWSVKDILAHIAAWETLMITWLRALRAGDLPDRPAPGQPGFDFDAVNARIHAENKDKPLDEVVQTFRASYNRALRAVSAVPAEALESPDHWPWCSGTPFSHILFANTTDHYRQHVEALEAWAQG